MIFSTRYMFFAFCLYPILFNTAQKLPAFLSEWRSHFCKSSCYKTVPFWIILERFFISLFLKMKLPFLKISLEIQCVESLKFEKSELKLNERIKALMDQAVLYKVGSNHSHSDSSLLIICLKIATLQILFARNFFYS